MVLSLAFTFILHRFLILFWDAFCTGFIYILLALTLFLRKLFCARRDSVGRFMFCESTVTLSSSCGWFSRRMKRREQLKSFTVLSHKVKTDLKESVGKDIAAVSTRLADCWSIFGSEFDVSTQKSEMLPFYNEDPFVAIKFRCLSARFGSYSFCIYSLSETEIQGKKLEWGS